MFLTVSIILTSKFLAILLAERTVITFIFVIITHCKSFINLCLWRCLLLLPITAHNVISFSFHAIHINSFGFSSIFIFVLIFYRQSIVNIFNNSILTYLAFPSKWVIYCLITSSIVHFCIFWYFNENWVLKILIQEKYYVIFFIDKYLFLRSKFLFEFFS